MGFPETKKVGMELTGRGEMAAKANGILNSQGNWDPMYFSRVFLFPYRPICGKK